MAISKVAVIGAGTMGAGIAAQIANAGTKVVLLDLIPGAASAAVARLLKTEPAVFMHPRNAGLVTTGDLGTDLSLVADCDWIVEAIIERPDAKRALYAQLDALRKPGSVVSSNTSTIPLADLLAEATSGFAADFMITHFFNPPRYMRLLEVVTGPATRPAAAARVSQFCDASLGKTVIDCRDTPGFIANRIGTLWMSAGIRHAIDHGLTVEEADAIAGPPMGVPRTGIFGLIDLVGMDLMPLVSGSLLRTLRQDDAFHAVHRDEPLMARLIAEGRTGRKGKGGFYTLVRDGAKRIKQAVDLTSGEYRPEQPPALESLKHARDLRKLAEHEDRGGRYARALLLDTLSYAASLVPEINDRIEAIDGAMKLGYNWARGPFEIIDQLGAAWLANALRQDRRPVPVLLEAVGQGSFYRIQNGRRQAFGPDGAYHDIARPEGVLLLEDLRLRAPKLADNASASLWDTGDGVALLEFHSKMNALDPAIMALITETIALGTQGAFKALVIGNDGAQFSVGANLKLALEGIGRGAWDEIAGFAEAGQIAFRALRHAPFPVVGAAHGMAFGGGCEVLLHCDAVQAHAESYIGLVEIGVGLLPSWGGCATMLLRYAADKATPKGPMPAATRAFELIAAGQVSKSAADAMEIGLLRRGDGITMNRDRLLADAKARALALVDGYTPPEPKVIKLAGESGRWTFRMGAKSHAELGRAAPHDLIVCDEIARVLTGGDADPTEEISEDALYRLEREGFLALARTEPTQARMRHMLETGKPLRN